MPYLAPWSARKPTTASPQSSPRKERWVIGSPFRNARPTRGTIARAARAVKDGGADIYRRPRRPASRPRADALGSPHGQVQWHPARMAVSFTFTFTQGGWVL